MKTWILAGAILSLIGTASLADDERYWVVGNRGSNTCDIVTSSPVISGNIWFAWGPYTTRDDAVAARSIIRGC
jgi:hypothetical protein